MVTIQRDQTKALDCQQLGILLSQAMEDTLTGKLNPHNAIAANKLAGSMIRLASDQYRYKKEFNVPGPIEFYEPKAVKTARTKTLEVAEKNEPQQPAPARVASGQ